MASYSTSIATINPSINVHEIKCNKNELANEIVGFHEIFLKKLMKKI
jgi:hypothetical protein